jgi:hypothetical protein
MCERSGAFKMSDSFQGFTQWTSDFFEQLDIVLTFESWTINKNESGNGASIGENWGKEKVQALVCLRLHDEATFFERGLKEKVIADIEMEILGELGNVGISIAENPIF